MLYEILIKLGARMPRIGLFLINLTRSSKKSVLSELYSAESDLVSNQGQLFVQTHVDGISRDDKTGSSAS